LGFEYTQTGLMQEGAVPGERYNLQPGGLFYYRMTPSANNDLTIRLDPTTSTLLLVDNRDGERINQKALAGITDVAVVAPYVEHMAADQGSDSLTVEPFSMANIGLLMIVMGYERENLDGNDSVTLSVASLAPADFPGEVVVVGGSGLDSLILDGSDADEAFEVVGSNPIQLNGAELQLHVSGMEGLTINGKTGNDTVYLDDFDYEAYEVTADPAGASVLTLGSPYETEFRFTGVKKGTITKDDVPIDFDGLTVDGLVDVPSSPT
jgi:hypothetical protein